jgi:hypothetical protein
MRQGRDLVNVTFVSGNRFGATVKWHDYHMPGVGLPARLVRPIKWIKRQAASGLKEGGTHYLTRKLHYDLASRGVSGIVVVSGSGGLLPDHLYQHPLPSTAVKTHGPAIPPGLERSTPRCQRLRRALGVSSVERSVEPSRRPLFTATTVARRGP